MKNGYDILILSTFLIVIAAIKKRKNDGVGKIPYGELMNKKNTREILLSDDKNINVNNELIKYDSDDYVISDSIKDKTGIYRIKTKSDLDKVLKEIKKIDNGYIVENYEDSDNSELKLNRNEIFQSIYELFPRPYQQNAINYMDGYIYTLVYIASGNKFSWLGSSTTQGLKKELIATRTKGKGDRQAYKQILNDRNGTTPELLVEYISDSNYSTDVQQIKNGVLDAIVESATPKNAYQILKQIIINSNSTQNKIPF